MGNSNEVKKVLHPPSKRKHSIVELASAWRITTVFLLEFSLFSLSEVASMVGKRASECVKWANRLWETGSVEDSKRVGRPASISKSDVVILQKALAAASPGTSMKVILHKLEQEGKISKDHSQERWRIALIESGWSFQKVEFKLPLCGEDRQDRLDFAHFYRDVGLGNCAIFTDSKYFVAGTLDMGCKNQGYRSWAPDGDPRRMIRTQGNNYSIHVYGGVCKYGLTELTIVSGTKGLEKAYTAHVKVDGKLTEVPTGAVAHPEYRDIIMGGGPRKYKSLLKQAKALFEANSVQNWYWQQDGAPCHSIKDTTIGKETRRLISTIAPNIVKWPPSSPDLSPIENVWQHVERVLWRDYSWNSQATYQTALFSAWKQVGNDKKFIKNVMASVDRRSKDGDEGGRIAQVISRLGGQTDY